jgi:hypothetical protein
LTIAPRIEIRASARCLQPFIGFWTITDIGVYDIVGLVKIHRGLPRLITLQCCENTATEFPPAFQLASKFSIPPYGFVLCDLTKAIFGELTNIGLDIGVQLPRSDVVYMKFFFKNHICFLVGKPAVGA